ncbi:hypothetical protein ACLB2K_066760 [Fragaria x ananassa]
MQSAAARWREFKSRLIKVYIVPYLDQPEMLKYPPQDYKFINADHWMQFMTERTKPSFLARRRMNKDPHRLSRKGYIGLVVELKAQAEPIELKEKVSTGETSISGNNDVLKKALGKEHGGRVRGVAGFVNPTTYFYLPRHNSRQSIEETIKISLEKELAEQMAKIIEETRNKTMHFGP